jgi:transcriptional regulator GlxA family with amidase domain
VAVLHQGHHELTRRGRVQGCAATGDDEDTLSVVALGFDHDAGFGVVDGADPPLGEQYAGPVAGAVNSEHAGKSPTCSDFARVAGMTLFAGILPNMSEWKLRDVAAVACQGVGTFGLGVFSEVFGYDRTGDGLPAFDYAVVGGERGPLRTDTGLRIIPEHGLERLATADLVVVMSWEDDDEPSDELQDALRAAVDRGSRLLAHCTGAFAVAATGLLDGRRATTHWKHAEEFAARYPQVDLDPDVLFVDAGPVVTSAGTAAGIDASLYLVRQAYGGEVANAIARRMVVPPHRDGGQAQFIEQPVPPAEDPMRDVLAWAQENAAQQLTVEMLAARAHMSPRSFARHFRAHTGTTPYTWLLSQRVRLAERLLESADLPVDEVARLSGFGSAAGLREHFVRERGVSPQVYRRTFRTAATSS